MTLYICCPVWRETWWFVQPRSPRDRHKFSGLNKSSCLPTNWAINYLLYWKQKHYVILRRAFCCETWQGDMTSGGRHEDWSSLHVTSPNQSYFFIYRINYMRYNKWLYVPPSPLAFYSSISYLSIELHFVGVHRPYKLHRKEKQIECSAYALHENLLFFPMQFIWPMNTDKIRFNTYIYIFLQQSLSR